MLELERHNCIDIDNVCIELLAAEGFRINFGYSESYVLAPRESPDLMNILLHVRVY